MFALTDSENIVVFDVETTGLSPRRDCIIEFGAVSARREDQEWAEPAELDMLIRLPEGRPLPSAITGLTGITSRMLEESGTEPALAAERAAELISAPETVLAAYNAHFDLSFLYWFLKRFGLEGCLKHIKMLDILTVYRDRRPYPHRLSDAVSAYSLSCRGTHRAVDDARASWELLLAMREELDDIGKYINLFGFNPRYGVSGPKISSVTYRAQGYGAAKKLYEQ